MNNQLKNYLDEYIKNDSSFDSVIFAESLGFKVYALTVESKVFISFMNDNEIYVNQGIEINFDSQIFIYYHLLEYIYKNKKISVIKDLKELDESLFIEALNIKKNKDKLFKQHNIKRFRKDR